MADFNFQLRGWHALLAIPLVLGFLGIQLGLRMHYVDDKMRDGVRKELLNEYSGRGPADAARIVEEAREGSPVEPVQPLVQRDVEFTSIGAHGKMGASEILVRAEITVDGGPPPDGRTVRYFRMSQMLGGAWMVIGESDSYFYYSDLLP
jgi:hypothetical protein